MIDFNKALNELFAKHLEGKKAYVRIGGVKIEGALEGKVKLQCSAGNFFGLDCLIDLKWNEVKIKNLLADGVRGIEPAVSYELLGKIIKTINHVIDTECVKAANISCYDVKSFTVTTQSSGQIGGVSIVYANDSIVEITNIK